MRYLQSLYETLRTETSGNVADYIPELAKANPDDLGIVICTVDGTMYAIGDIDRAFTIQSISKAFVYGYALAEYGREYTLTKVGVEPSGDAFNAIVFDEAFNRPFNPMVNSGAIATAALIKGDTVADRIETMRHLFEGFAGRPLTINDAVFRSEKETGHRNRAIAWMMLNSGMIDRNPEDVLDVYFAQCSVEVTCLDLGLMAATLANGGRQPRTGNRVLPAAAVRDVVSVMNSCGMYNYAGQWSFEIGLAAKSGVGGGIIAVAPGQLGIAVYSPKLDRLGNSVRGIAAFKAISHDFGLHVFDSHTHGGAIIRREIGADVVRSKRLRSREERKLLDAEGRRIRLVELQGALYFGTAERVVRRIEALAKEADWVILDFRRVHSIDHAALELLDRVSVAPLPQILISDLPQGATFADLARRMTARGTHAVYPDTDAALQWCEDKLIGQSATGLDSQYALNSLSLFTGLSRDEVRLLESIVKPLVYEPGQVIVQEGEPARLLYVIARGAVGVRLRGADTEPGKGRRVAGFGPGVSFGEMALVDGGKRTADIVAEEHVVCYAFSVEDLRAVGKEHPNVLVTILGNVSRETTERLGRANAEIRALEA